MAHPATAKSEARKKAQKKGSALGSPKSPNKVTKSAQEAPKMEYFSKFPSEIQQMIWFEAAQKPACHTFKIARVENEEPRHAPWYTYRLTTLRVNIDPSPHRYWKTLMWHRHYNAQLEELVKKEKRQARAKKKNPNAKERAKLKLEMAALVDIETSGKSDAKLSNESFSKLANISFQTGFQRSMGNLCPMIAKKSSDGRNSKRSGYIDEHADLVILEFDRGENAQPHTWFEHTGNGDMSAFHVRQATQHVRRLAVHYKRNHAPASARGPFQCWCQTQAMECNKFKACPMEQACFLDCFQDLEEFSLVVEVTSKKELVWLDKYRCKYNYFTYLP
jgi:hypothetical protein